MTAAYAASSMSMLARAEYIECTRHGPESPLLSGRNVIQAGDDYI
ncbi:MAG: hypothetical protein OXH83_16645 [Bryobacterales bacterium]|nr:hypothetical protein [Bryobacterales bacterium]